MTYEEYVNEVSALQQKHKEEIFEVAKRFALANNTVNIGDTISSQAITIKVSKIHVTFRMSRKPECVYSGPCLTKKGVPYKNGEHGSIYQSGIKK